CYCLPHQRCFPSPPVWHSFSKDIGGRLIQARPAAYPCHDPHYDEAACKVAKTKWTDALWRSDQVGASQHPQWDSFKQQKCLINASDTCYQGAVPIYAVDVRQADDVSKAFAFATKHHIRVIVKNTGHDYLGRSDGRGALSIWTHNLKTIDFSDNFERFQCPFDSKDGQVSAVTVGAGVQFGELYKAVAAQNKIVIAFDPPSVGAAGGYVGGGGHSVLAPTYGLPADNILEINVVTPDGSYFVANECQNKDLFWALRGGGPATFGVVLSVTYRTHPAPAAVTNVHHEVSANDSSSLRDFIAEYARLMPSIADKGYGGSFAALPNAGHLNYVLPGGNQSAAQQDWQPLVDFAASHPGLNVLQRVTMFPNFYAFFNATLCNRFKTQCTDLTGTNEILASRLLPRSLFVNSPDAIADAYMDILTRNSSNGARNFILTMSVGGGAGALGDEHSAALNPAWRKALWHTIIQAVWDDDASDDVIQHKFVDITNANQVFRDLAPESGSYMNEGDYNEPDWQTSFFGEHYERLVEIKALVDPHDVLACRNCVGSEAW
ncbi:hypothetical protein SELMODRAFT_1347, partial [Selaginella moellendorffii]